MYLCHAKCAHYSVKQAAIFLLLLSFLAANLPFLTERRFLFMQPTAPRKHLAWRLLELIILYFLVGVLAYFFERSFGPPHKHTWEFYAITACLFLVFAFPGFIYRYLWRKT